MGISAVFSFALCLTTPDDTTLIQCTKWLFILKVDVRNISDYQYKEYIQLCKNAGFSSVVQTYNGNNFEAYDDEGYHLNLEYNKRKSEMSIYLEKMESFEWPLQGLALQLPMPSVTFGEIIINNDNVFWIELKGITNSQYEEYINLCKEKGFIKDAEKNPVSYKALNEEDYGLMLVYDDYSCELTIRIETPKQMKKTN